MRSYHISQIATSSFFYQAMAYNRPVLEESYRSLVEL